MMSSVVERVLRYVRIDTESMPDSATFPTTDKEKDLALLLVQELREMGAEAVDMDEYGYVYATIPATVEGSSHVLGFIAHMDTSPAVSGANVKPRIVEKYDGGDIVLNRDLNIVLSPQEYPDILEYTGQDIIVTDGTTLLGADDKAGVAEIMEMARVLLSDRSIPHGVIKIAFTPDEEVGHGADHFDVARFGADFAYTVDGSRWGEIEYENFNAADVRLTVRGKSIHPGSAKGKMKNALILLMEFQRMLPPFDNPAFTENYEGFFHLEQVEGDVEKATARYIIRDHDRENFEARKERVRKICQYLNDLHGVGSFSAVIKDSYYNMKEKILPHMHLIEKAQKALLTLGAEPQIVPIRGGTDGSRLSYMGLPCPNLCAGGHNFHGRYEYIPVPSLENISRLLVELAKLYAK